MAGTKNWLAERRGWLVVIALFVEAFVSCGPTYNYSILFVSFREEFSSSAVLTGWVGSLANALLHAASPISALFYNRFGPRATLLLGTFLYCGGFLLTSLIPAIVYAFFTFGLMVGFGTGFVIQASFAVILEWFPKKNCSRSTSFMTLGSSFGVLAFGPLMNSLIDVYGWRNALRIIGGGNLVIGLLFGTIITSPKQCEASVPDTKQEKTDDRDTSEKENNEPCPKKVTVLPSEVTLIRRLGQFLLCLDAWMWNLCLILGFIAWSFITVNFASFLERSLVFNTSQVSTAIVLLATGEIIGKVALSLCGDHLPCLKLYVVAAGSVLGAGAAVLLIVVKTQSATYALSFFIGVFRAASYIMPLAAAMEIFGDKYGADVVTQAVLFPWGLGIFIGAPIIGGLFDLTGDYGLSLIVIAVVFIASAVTVLVIPTRRHLTSSASLSVIPIDYVSVHST